MTVDPNADEPNASTVPRSPRRTAEQRCPNCRVDDTRPVVALGSARVVACNGCGLQFAASYPEIETVGAEMYGAAYFTRAIREQEARRHVFGQLLDEIDAVLGDTRPGRRLLDVGAGEGTLLQVAAQRGWSPVGIDVARDMVQHVQQTLGLPMHHGTLEEVPLEPRSFDAVILNHVLEHVRDPVHTLRRIATLLDPGGVVRVEVPNLASLSSRLKSAQSRLGFKSHPWKHYSVEHHFWFFTPGTLAATFRSAGLEVVRLSTPARQWGAGAARASNRLHDRLGWGKHIVAYGRPAPPAP